MTHTLTDMAKSDEVMRMVEEVLKTDPKVDNEVLFERAKGIDPAIGELDLRQFNARYPLQVRRRRALEPAAVGADSREDLVRRILTKFGMEMAAAETRQEVAKCMGDIDKYVQEVLATIDA